jgi:methylenetetrahydrofolate reductase (NADPH)
MGASASRIGSGPGRAGPAPEVGSAARALAERLHRPRYEVLPLEGVEEELESVGTDVTITVTGSPKKGLVATLELSERLARRGYDVVPHLAARLVRDRAQLDEILDGLLAAGVRRLFVPAGDRTVPCGEFEDAAALLSAMGSRRGKFEEVGITGYPESHHLIPDEETIRAMFEKSEMATHIVSQICFDAEIIVDWIRNVRERGTDLPIWIGLPGVVSYRKLARISMKIGLGESARFLTHQHGLVSRLLTHSFSPDDLVRDLAPTVADPAATVAGFHLYTFNEVARTERWRRETLERLARTATPPS